MLTLTYDYLRTCLSLTAKANVDQEILSYVETVFKSLACFNSSFLLANEEHYCCTSRHHGVNVEQAEKAFDLIGKLEVESIKDLVIFIIDPLLNFHVTYKSKIRGGLQEYQECNFTKFRHTLGR